jgi:tetratricopeptide (TPR) repeat protein
MPRSELIDAGLAINPNAAVAHNSRGAVLKELGRNEEAPASYDRAIALKPDYAEALNNRGVAIFEPFWPECVRFDRLPAGGHAGLWFVASVVEQYERVRAFSSFFQDDASWLDWFCERPFASNELRRRRALIAARAKRKLKVPEQLCAEAPDHLNAEVWRSGLSAVS